jgi:DNA primase
LWYCYSHKTGGDIFNWIAVEEGIVSCQNAGDLSGHFHEVLQVAADRAGIELEDDRYDSGLFDTFAGVIDVLHEQLDESLLEDRTVRGYIKDKRGFTDETIDRAKIGYLSSDVRHDLKEQFGESELKDLGFIKENGTWHVNERIVYPYLKSGTPIYWIGRRTSKTNDQKDSAKYVKPINSVVKFEQPLYGALNPRSDNLWIVEGIQDALSLRQAGESAVTPVATNPSDEQFEEIARRAQGYEDVVICFDGDKSGRKRAVDVTLSLLRQGVQIKVGKLEADDPNEHFASGGEVGEVEVKSAPIAVLEEKGDDRDTVRNLLSTVKPDTLAADDLVDTISDATAYRKNTLRKELRKSHRESAQSEFTPPEKVEKIDGEDPTWRFIFPSGDKIELGKTGLAKGPKRFREEYIAQFDFNPEFSKKEWREYINDWLADVEVIAENGLTKSELLREKIEHGIAHSTVYSHEDREQALESHSGVVLDSRNKNEEIWVPKDLMKRWIDDYDVPLQELASHLEPVFIATSQRRFGDKNRRRVWRFRKSALENSDELDNPVETEENHSVYNSNDST